MDTTPTTTSLQNKTVLVVEDNETMLQTLVYNLSLEGIQTFEAADGEEAVKVALEKKPDLLLLDLIIPKIDGVSVMKQLRATEWGRTLAIIVITNLEVDGPVMKDVMEEKPAYYLSKTDISLGEIVSKIKEVLSRTPAK